MLSSFTIQKTERGALLESGMTAAFLEVLHKLITKIKIYKRKLT